VEQLRTKKASDQFDLRLPPMMNPGDTARILVDQDCSGGWIVVSWSSPFDNFARFAWEPMDSTSPLQAEMDRQLDAQRARRYRPWLWHWGPRKAVAVGPGGVPYVNVRRGRRRSEELVRAALAGPDKFYR
jgi:hypothetical protein